ncbi:unnamed protein product [Lepeophtheirus salmonis]|uniref:(salmon louse) hypothetical protein n=1 Tax=Lepeophtheirus salmonis TaxID=72036 RepID=A0A7R8CAT6_LEPSM|nr:unnamed protein product [Lepeophtheirus salmonis]CAF2749996.1 unnamed protein product [Lepeophtheirus salmonis]
MTKVTDIKKHTKNTVIYPNLKSAFRPIPLNEKYTVHVSPNQIEIIDHPSEDIEDEYGEFPSNSPSKPHLLGQEELNDLIRDLHLTKQPSEILASMLKRILNQKRLKSVFTGNKIPENFLT